MCIYQRTAVTALIFTPIPAILAPQSTIARFVSLGLSLVAVIWGWNIANEHIQMQDPANFMLLLGCDVIPNFPSWLQLHTWLPSLFEPRGTCGDIDWSFVGLSMPQWMSIIFAGYFISLVFVYSIRLVKTRSL